MVRIRLAERGAWNLTTMEIASIRSSPQGRGAECEDDVRWFDWVWFGSAGRLERHDDDDNISTQSRATRVGTFDGTSSA